MKPINALETAHVPLRPVTRLSANCPLQSSTSTGGVGPYVVKILREFKFSHKINRHTQTYCHRASTVRSIPHHKQTIQSNVNDAPQNNLSMGGS